MAIEVHDVPDEKHFVALVDGVPAGRVEYLRTAGLIAYTHTEVDPAFEGKGVGSALAAAVLDQAREWGLPVLPQCPFIASYIARHPQYADVVYRRSEPTG